MRSVLAFHFIVIVLLAAAGCAPAAFDVLQPAPARQFVGSKTWGYAGLDELDYNFLADEGRLVVLIHNPTPDPITLAGDRSYIVSPDGQSHPLRSGGATIAPRSYVKLILPPPRPQVADDNPGFGVGYIGGGFGDHPGRIGYYDDAFAGGFYDAPRNATVYDPSNAVYWDWPDEGLVRLSLAYNRGSPANTFTHEFTFRRVKE